MTTHGATVRAVREVDRALREHGVVGSITFAFACFAAMMGVAVWASGDAGVARTAIKWISCVFLAYLAGVLVFSYLSPESAAMEGSQLLELRLATKDGPLPAAPTGRAQ